MWWEALLELLSLLGSVQTSFRAQTRFEGEPENKMFQAAGLVDIAKFSDNIRKLKCSEATVANTTHISGCDT